MSLLKDNDSNLVFKSATSVTFSYGREHRANILEIIVKIAKKVFESIQSIYLCDNMADNQPGEMRLSST